MIAPPTILHLLLRNMVYSREFTFLFQLLNRIYNLAVCLIFTLAETKDVAQSEILEMSKSMQARLFCC